VAAIGRNGPVGSDSSDLKEISSGGFGLVRWRQFGNEMKSRIFDPNRPACGFESVDRLQQCPAP
jgi:hypothetical protein